MVMEVKVRISKKNTLYIPKAMAEAIGIKGGDLAKLRVEGSRLILEAALDPFKLALKGTKFAKTTFEEFERESEEMQNDLFGEA